MRRFIMSIGIITLHFQNNYGAVLQTYALWKKCSQVCKTEVIDYVHNKNEISKGNKYAKYMKLLFEYKKVKYKRIKAAKFSDFRKNYIDVSSKSYHGDASIISNPPSYDVYLSGSDQIWNTNITNCSSAYFLSFVRTGVKMSYASSFGHEDLSDNERQLSAQYLPLFKFISVREEASAKELSELLKRKVFDVLDPVFLLKRKDWGRLLEEQKGTTQKGYYFIYIMEDNDAIKKAAIWASQKKTDIIYLFGSENINPKRYPKGKIIYDAGPIDFLRLIANSDLVITNSFHGTAFSIIFGKKLMVCEHTKRNVRIVNLLKSCSSEHALITSGVDSNIQDKIIDGNTAYNKLDFTNTNEAITIIEQQCTMKA